MHIGKVIGRVVATQKDSSLHGYKLLVIQPMTCALKESGTPLVCIDASYQAGLNEWVHYVTGAEASLAIPQQPNPADAAIVGIIDHIYTD